MKVLIVRKPGISSKQLDEVFNKNFPNTKIPFSNIAPGEYPIVEKCVIVGGSSFNAVIFRNMMKYHCSIHSERELMLLRRIKPYTLDQKKKKSWSNSIYGGRILS